MFLLINTSISLKEMTKKYITENTQYDVFIKRLKEHSTVYYKYKSTHTYISLLV